MILVRLFFRLIIIAVLLAAGAMLYYSWEHHHSASLNGNVASLVQSGERVLEDSALVKKTEDAAKNLFAQAVSSATDKLIANNPLEDTGAIKVYFAPCQPLNPFGIEHAFTSFLKGAKKSIYGAFYELELKDAADVLVEKHNAGIDVRLVSDSDYEKREAMQECVAAGIPVVFDQRKPFMHDKFCVVDDAYVWTGSTNVTDNCMYRNDNNSLLIGSEQLAADYGIEFSKMFDKHRFGKPSTENVPYPEVTIGDTQIECFFSPDDHIAGKIEDRIKSTKSSIDFMAFAFTSPDIAKAMAKRIDAGVKVRGIFDEKEANSEYCQRGYLAEHGTEVFRSQNHYTMHNKVMILDGETVITGSYNFTKAAETKNDENVLIIHSPDIAKKYEATFESLLPK